MNILVDNRIAATLVSGVALWSSACNGQLSVVDDLDSHGENLTSEPPLDDNCMCATSSSLRGLSCGGAEIPLLDNDIVQTTVDGNVVVFNQDDGLGGFNVIYWDSNSPAYSLSTGLLLGLNAAGDKVLVAPAGEPGVHLIDLDSASTTLSLRSTPFPLQMVVGHGALNAAGDTIVGEVYDGNGTHLAKANAATGDVELLGDFTGPISRAYVNPDSSAIVGHASIQILSVGSVDFRWSEQGLTVGVPGAPAGRTIWPEALSADGSVIAGRSLPGQTHFRWTEAAGYVELAPASARSETFLSADGSVVLGSLDPEGASDSSAFRWTAATGAVEIAPEKTNLALDMSDDGSVVVALSWEEAQLEGAPPEATFVWDTVNGTRSLDAILAARGVDTSGWEFGHPRVLSGNGKVLLGRAHCGGLPTLYRIVLSD